MWNSKRVFNLQLQLSRAYRYRVSCLVSRVWMDGRKIALLFCSSTVLVNYRGSNGTNISSHIYAEYFVWVQSLESWYHSPRDNIKQ